MTPDERRCVPPGVETVIDLGQRVCTSGMMIEIALRLGLESLLEGEAFQRYAQEVVPVIRQSACIGAFALLRRFNDVEARQSELRSPLYHNGHYAKYSFADVIGQSEAIRRTKETLARMALSESPALQIKLLRALQEREVMRVGGNRIIHVDVRIEAATNEALEQKVREGSFRRDLYYRLSTLPALIPPLTERGDDMFLLTEHFRRELGGSFRLTEPVKDFFRRHAWPGNIRELRNAVEYFIYTGHEDIGLEDLPPTLFLSGSAALRHGASPDLEAAEPSDAFHFLLSRLYDASESGTPMGRESLLKQAREAHIPLSQREVRDILADMAAQGLVRVSRGRGGSRLTPKGRARWEMVQNKEDRTN